MHEWVTGTGPANHGDQLHRDFVYFFRGFDHGSYKPVIWICPSGGFTTEEFDLHIFEALRVEVGAKLLKDVLRLLVRNEAEIHLGRRLRRLNGLRAGTLISAGQSTDRTSRREDFFHPEVNSTSKTFDELFDTKTSFVFLSNVRKRLHQFAVACAWLFHIIIKAGDADALIGSFEAR